MRALVVFAHLLLCTALQCKGGLSPETGHLAKRSVRDAALPDHLDGGPQGVTAAEVDSASLDEGGAESVAAVSVEAGHDVFVLPDVDSSVYTPCPLPTITALRPTDVSVDELVGNRRALGSHVRVLGRVTSSGTFHAFRSVCRSSHDERDVDVVFAERACIPWDEETVLIEADVEALHDISGIKDGPIFRLTRARAVARVTPGAWCSPGFGRQR